MRLCEQQGAPTDLLDVKIFICICISINPGSENFDIFVFVFPPTQVVMLAEQRTHSSSPSSPSWSAQNRWSAGSRTSSWCLLLLLLSKYFYSPWSLLRHVVQAGPEFHLCPFFFQFSLSLLPSEDQIFLLTLVSIKACWSVTSRTSSRSLFLTNNFGLSRWWVGWYHNDYVVPLTHF